VIADEVYGDSRFFFEIVMLFRCETMLPDLDPEAYQ
jgi:hypothetical protein